MKRKQTERLRLKGQDTELEAELLGPKKGFGNSFEVLPITKEEIKSSKEAYFTDLEKELLTRRERAIRAFLR